MNPISERIVQFVINWNEAQRSIGCLANAKKNVPRQWPIIIVDNNSTDHSVELILSYLSADPELKRSSSEDGHPHAPSKVKAHVFKGSRDVVLLVSNENLGVSRAWNLGLEWAQDNYAYDFAFIFDNESRIEPQTIPCCLAQAKAAKASLVGCMVKNADDSVQFLGKSFYKNIFYLDSLIRQGPNVAFLDYWDVDLISGCGMLISKKLLDHVFRYRGFYFHPDYFYLAEDQEFSLASKLLGYRVIIARGAVVYHDTNRKKVGWNKAHYYSSRNRVYLANSYLPVHLRSLFHVYYPAYRISRALFHMFKGEFCIGLSHVQGLRDAYRGKKGIWENAKKSI